MGEVGFGTPFGFIENASDVNGMLKAFREGMPMFGLLGRLYPFTIWIKKTWVGKRYLVAKPEDSTGWGFFMRLRDNLIDQRKMKVKANTLGNRVDVLQSSVFGLMAFFSTVTDKRTDSSRPVLTMANPLTPNTSRLRSFLSFSLELIRQELRFKVYCITSWRINQRTRRW